ncbi:hypothetical protein LQ948_04230 [Jiella sp. MQZ9-1]|uniref:Uncharacterized protein n=1 Tax=Jiella flava TaxID=2816857 RepID=A0A939FVX8_9HYPH|nr:hypothetical protein [Jiella flava]MBO0661771.1 hypothetical protein [Jiella flava]MCD2470412.1 hypothetical protein [Jiella flava]
MIGRADLSDDALVDALKARLASCNRSVDDAECVLEAAMAGDAEAISLLRSAPVPAPSVKLAMPIQSLTRDVRRRGFGLASLRLSWHRG